MARRQRDGYAFIEYLVSYFTSRQLIKREMIRRLFISVSRMTHL